ncbi:MAG TPA: hypothetical protein VEJ86_05465, partial [Candidatus Binataceae bacterium]|nr:hypothetical protein [Candidatus Binataceae bacterium]
DESASGQPRVLSVDSIRAMKTEQSSAMFEGKMGLAWWLSDVGGLRLVSHGGATHGQISTFVMVPERHFAISVLTNSGIGGKFATEVHNLAYQQFLGITVPEPKPIETTPESLPEYVGHYRAAMDDIEIKLADGILMMQVIPRGGFPTRNTPAAPPGPPTRLGFTRRDWPLALDPPLSPVQGEFLRGAGGAIEWLRWGARIHRKL